jgi:glycosyltransferase involved in cell wall biosynthesis
MPFIPNRDTQSNSLKKIVWVTFLVLDAQLHKTSQFEILGNLAKRGHEATLIAIRSKSQLQSGTSQFRVISIPLRNIPIITGFVYGLLIFLFLPFYTIFCKPDFVITQPTIPITSLLSTLPISHIRKTKFILDIRTIIVDIGFRGFLHDFLFTTSILVANKLFDGITIITSPMKDEICRKYGLDPKRIGVWSSGFSPTLFNPEKWLFEGLEMKSRLGLKEKFVVFYHGTFSPNRGLIETVEAMKLLKLKYPDVTLFLLGSGPMTPALNGVVNREQLHDKVVIHEPVNYEDVPKYIAMSDVAIIPLPDMHYWRSQSPLKLLEYLAMQKVVIASDIPAHRAVIGEEKCGIYISAIKPEKIAESITFAFQNRERLSDWGKIGRITLGDKYTWQKVASDLENYLLSVP